MRVGKAVIPVLVLMVVAAGCSSSDGEGEQRLTAQRENYCKQLGTWQRALNADRTPDPSGYDEVEAVAQDAFLAMRPLRDEAVGEGRTLAEATVAAMNNSDTAAAGRLVHYCQDAGFETLMR